MSTLRSRFEKRGKDTVGGFTLIEILVVIGIIAVLAAIVIVAINPARQFAQAHNTQRTSNVEAILSAIGQNLADNKGIFTCGTALPSTATTMKTGGYDIRTCLVPTYIPEIPVDPTTGTSWTGSTYDTGYTVTKDSTTGRVTVAAPATELGVTAISLTR